MTLCNYWKAIPQFVPLNGFHTDICVLRISAVQAEHVYIFVQWKFVLEKIKKSVNFCIHCMRNWKMVSLDRARRKLSFEV